MKDQRIRRAPPAPRRRDEAGSNARAGDSNSEAQAMLPCVAEPEQDSGLLGEAWESVRGWWGSLFGGDDKGGEEAPSPAPGGGQQAPGPQQPTTDPAIDAMRASATLTHEQIAAARDAIARLPQDQRAALYEELARKADYRSQRDNVGTYARKDADWAGAEDGDAMCNFTSIAMALNQLGVGMDESGKQLEDSLDETLVEEGLGSRYDGAGQAAVAAKFGVAAQRKFAPFSSAQGAQEWFTKAILPELQAGAAATMGMRWGAGGQYAHIVRLEWVDADGVRVDDPYGRLVRLGNGVYDYAKNDASSSEGEGAKGEDNKWSWDTVAAVMGGYGDRYVQLLTRGGAPAVS